jgi:predicted RNase H-like HicB family nuclease
MLAYAHVSDEMSRVFASNDDSVRDRSILVITRQLPEGVWLAISPDVYGLAVEADTFDELRAEVREWAPQLLRDNHGMEEGETLVFFYGSPKDYSFP